MKWIETITPKQAAEELGVPYHGWMREMDRAWISADRVRAAARQGPWQQHRFELQRYGTLRKPDRSPLR